MDHNRPTFPSSDVKPHPGLTVERQVGTHMRDQTHGRAVIVVAVAVCGVGRTCGGVTLCGDHDDG